MMAAKSSALTPGKSAAAPHLDTTITGMKTTLLRVPWVGDPPPNGIMPMGPREYLVVEIMTKGGLTGMGYLQLLRGGGETVDACLKELMWPMIKGRDATEIEGIWQSLVERHLLDRPHGRRRSSRCRRSISRCGTSSENAPTCRSIGCGGRAGPRCRPMARAAGGAWAATA